MLFHLAGPLCPSYLFRRLLILMVIGLNSHFLFAQQPYFQQGLVYDISVTLDDDSHMLRGDISITYTNNSRDTLGEIMMHLWPNAYRDRNTALTRQLLQNRNKSLYFAKPHERGFIDSLAFSVNGERATLNPHPEHADIGILSLPQLLLPGGSIRMASSFRVKIPVGRFSRLGHVGQSYQVSQWYPKPAVYDRDGWHAMPYLDQGEFYSEFGSYHVTITLPENYVVAASGVLTEERERLFLEEKARVTAKMTSWESSMRFPPSSTALKTISFRQDSIHDFAWFADKRFHVLKKSFQPVAGGKTIEAWAFFTNKEAGLWQNSLDYIEKAVRFYSNRVGTYPYSHCTAVDATVSAGAGMEYPLVAVIGTTGSDVLLENVIVHEVGHNWFYGMLATDERKHGWMDEGINSFYEMAYVRHHYPGDRGKGVNELSGMGKTGRLMGTGDLTIADAFRYGYRFSAFDNTDQPVNTLPEQFTSLNYGAVMYNKTALSFQFLEDYLGTGVFEACMQSYFEDWKFRHPGPEALQASFESVSGKNLGWFFDDFLASREPVRYRILKKRMTGGELNLVTENKGRIPVPVKIGVGDSSRFFEGFTGKRELTIQGYNGGPVYVNPGYRDLFKSGVTLHRDRRILSRAPKVQFRPLPRLSPDENSRPLTCLPMVAWNRYNSVMGGVTFSNFSYIPTRFEFSFTPLLDFKHSDIAGVGSIRYHHYPLSGSIQGIHVSLSGKRFAYGKNLIGGEPVEGEREVFNYSRAVPSVEILFRKRNPRSPVTHRTVLRYIALWKEEINYVKSGNLFIRDYGTRTYNSAELVYRLSNNRIVDPYSLQVKFEQGDGYNKVSTEFSYRFSYARSNKGADIRIFAGAFPDNRNTDLRNVNFKMSGGAGSQDYLYDELYFGRTDVRGLWRQQFVVADGGFKAPTAVGQTDKWLAAVNLSIDLPIPLPVCLFADLGTYEGISTVFTDLDNKIMYDGGIAVKPVRGFLEIYVPLFYSSDIETAYDANDTRFFQKVRFVFNLTRLFPFHIRDSVINQYK